MCAGFQEMGYQIGGFDAYITSNVISAAGVSSSASYEMLICSMINEFFNDGKVDIEHFSGYLCRLRTFISHGKRMPLQFLYLRKSQFLRGYPRGDDRITCRYCTKFFLFFSLTGTGSRIRLVSCPSRNDHEIICPVKQMLYIHIGAF